MLTLTSKTRFGAMRGCQEQIYEAHGQPDNILLVGWGGVLHFGIRVRLIGCLMVSTRSTGSLKGVDCVRTWEKALNEHAHLE